MTPLETAFQSFLNNFPPLPFKRKRALPKSKEDSESWFLVANQSFRNKKFSNAIEAYNASLCYALPESEDIPLIYANRSAVYCDMGEYGLALENIQLARKAGITVGEMAQLDAREEKCRRFIETIGLEKYREVSSFFKLSHPPNPKIPFIADCLELRQNKKYGRHIVTTRNLKAGEIIGIETLAFPWLTDLGSDPAC